jgi:hypothetical protein
MSARGDSVYVDRAPAKSPAMAAAYLALAASEAEVSAAHAAADWSWHAEAVLAFRAAHALIGQLAQAHR